MAKRLKLRLSRILSNCRSKNVLPSNPLPSVPKPTPLSFESFPRTPSSSPKLTYHWKQEKDFHVISISTFREKTSLNTSKVFPRPPFSRRARRCRTVIPWGRKHERVRLAPLLIFRGKAALGDQGLEADDREELECLMSSASSTSEEGFDDEACEVKNAKEQGLLLMKKRVSYVEYEARLSSVERRWSRGDNPMGMIMTTKVRESYAVVKRTEDPYGEFRISMMEMMTEKEIYEEDGLLELLRCLLSLNGREHHAIILRAFSEVRDALFRKKISFDYNEDQH
ncbi:hypothetical protein MLD38_007750 [Melastoma candidum]|uniref:Uncharacterized protein n=1 Tax=Melastoma candidum TaxID=119954 RepID=A0ACB9RTF0_9MYRT|nr:hypothetical protein MLD38_007750 [Melastoma candidum]